MVGDAVETALKKIGSNPYRAAQKAGLPDNAIRYIIEGRQVKISRLSEVCEAIGLEFYVGPPRGNDVACTKEHLDRDTMNKAISCVAEGVEKSGKSYNNQEIANLALAAYDFLHDDPNNQDSQPADKSAKIIQLMTKFKAA